MSMILHFIAKFDDGEYEFKSGNLKFSFLCRSIDDLTFLCQKLIVLNFMSNSRQFNISFFKVGDLIFHC